MHDLASKISKKNSGGTPPDPFRREGATPTCTRFAPPLNVDAACLTCVENVPPPMHLSACLSVYLYVYVVWTMTYIDGVYAVSER